LLLFIQIYHFILLGRIILSFFQAGFYHNPAMGNLYRVLYGLTEPLLAPIRKVIPAVRMGMGYLDLSPLILLILLSAAQRLIISYL
jgi:YggT family protein